MERRTLLALGASTIALGAVGAGAWIQRRRQRDLRVSQAIMGEWPRLGQGQSWLLPDLHEALMLIPDRPHASNEDDDVATRALIQRRRSFTVTTSSQRLRMASVQQLPQAGVQRLLAIGDSTVFGWGVAGHESWPARLQAELDRRGHRAEIINAGVPSLKLQGMFLYIEKVAARMGISGAILSRRPSPQTDVMSFEQMAVASRERLHGARIQFVLPPVSRFDINAREHWRRESEQLVGRLRAKADTPMLDLTHAVREAQRGHGCDLVRQGGQLLVRREDSGEVLLRVRQPAHDIPRAVYDLFEADPTVKEHLIFDGGHLDAEGNLLAATIIADELEAQGWFVQPASPAGTAPSSGAGAGSAAAGGA